MRACAHCNTAAVRRGRWRSSSGATTAPQSLIEGFTNFRYSRMDFEYALWLMFSLCIYTNCIRSSVYHSANKASVGARRSSIPRVAALSATCCMRRMVRCFKRVRACALFLYHSLIDLLLLGSVLSTIGWWFLNNFCTTGLSCAAHAAIQPSYRRLAKRQRQRQPERD